MPCQHQHPRSNYLVSGKDLAQETGLCCLTLEQIARREGIGPAWICSCDEVFYDVDAVQAIKSSITFLVTWAIEVLKQPLPDAEHQRLLLLSFAKPDDRCLADYFRFVGNFEPKSSPVLPAASD